MEKEEVRAGKGYELASHTVASELMVVYAALNAIWNEMDLDDWEGASEEYHRVHDCLAKQMNDLEKLMSSMHREARAWR